MGRHYVPKVYLRNFADGEQLWAFDRELQRNFPSHIDNLAQQNKYYSDELEDHFSKEIETPVESIFSAIRSKDQLSVEQRSMFSTFLSLQLKRVPEGKRRFHANFDRVADEVRNSTNSQIDSLVEKDPSLITIASQRKQEVHALVEKYKQAPPDNIWFQVLAGKRFDRIAEAIATMRWYFLHAPSGTQFLTSDNPVFHFSSYGLGSNNAELSLPIGHNIAMCADRRAGVDLAHVDTNRQLVQEINRRTVCNATRFVYARYRWHWVAKFAYKKQFKLNSIR